MIDPIAIIDTPIFRGKYIFIREADSNHPHIGRVATIVAHGKRGAMYGCLIYDNGERWHWVNMTRFSGSVPFDLAQINPSGLGAQ